MGVFLKHATRDDMKTIWRMQVVAFSDMLRKYQDYDTNPGAESYERLLSKYEQVFTRYYFIMDGGRAVGALRVVDRQDGSRKRISPVFIMPEYRNRGYAQQAIQAAEMIYGQDHWTLDTVLQEAANCHLYEKLGYHRTGDSVKINDHMDIVYYEKDLVAVRVMRPGDYEQVYTLWTSSKNMGLNNLDDSREGIERYLRRNPGTSFIAEADGKIIGVILSGHDGRRGYIYHMSVAESFRGQGIGTKLLEHSLEALKAEQINKVALVVFTRNEAGNAFWEHRGFHARDDLIYRNQALTELVRMDT